MRLRDGSGTGFTLVELLIVLGIFAVVAAITIPFATRVQDGNQMTTCMGHQRAIARALRMYRLDENGYPPLTITYCNQTGTTFPGAWAIDPDGHSTGLEYHLGLHALVEAGYLANESVISCPAAQTDPGQPAHYIAYEERDPDADGGVGIVWKYAPDRGVISTGDVNQDRINDYFRQLAPADSTPVNWQPDDTTVLTWCNNHVGAIKRGGQDQYIVVFYDGTVMLKDAWLFRDPTLLPPAAWRVKPTD